MEVSQGSVRLAAAFGEGVFSADCPTREALARVTSKWAPLLLAALSDGEPLRWNELRRRATGVTEKMLAQTLRMLEEDGYVHREARPVVPPHVEYSLTKDGEQLAGLLLALMTFVSDRALAGEAATG
jgi:DNA-binding HxlR family transcriptional regulator